MSDDRTGIQVENAVPPWERPGCFRRDCEPHRGRALRLMSFVSFVLSCIGLFPYTAFLALPALALSLTTWILCRRDQAEMRKGMRDPAGYERTEQARLHSLAALLISIGSCVVWGAVLGVLIAFGLVF